MRKPYPKNRKSCGFRKDLSGKTYGRLFVLYFVRLDKHKLSMWKCMCSCGKFVVVRSTALTNGRAKTCGCSRLKDLTGMIFGRYTVISFSRMDVDRCSLWNCLCQCGKTKEVRSYSLRSGAIISCGCYRDENVKRINTTHGMWGTPEYRSWDAMIQRCTNPNHENWSDYGGAGVTVCERWLNSFENFYEDMGDKLEPKDRYSIHRIKEFQSQLVHYNKESCKWATWEEQNDRSQKSEYTF